MASVIVIAATVTGTITITITIRRIQAYTQRFSCECTTYDKLTNKKHLKNVGPIHHCEPFYIAIHQVSLHTACALMPTTTTTTTTRDRGDRYGPMEWAQQITVNTTNEGGGVINL